MKKLFAICIVGIALGTAGAFADHPDGWGVGIEFGGPGFYGWGGIGYDSAHFQSYYRYANSYFSLPFAVSLKMPFLPIYWKLGISFGGVSGFSTFGLNVAGDYYFIDKVLVESAKLHWFLGAGGFAGFNTYKTDFPYITSGNGTTTASWMDFEFGGRFVVGLSWQPIPLIEVFLNATAALGLGFDTKVKFENDPGEYVLSGYNTDGKLMFPTGGIGAELGLRFWF